MKGWSFQGWFGSLPYAGEVRRYTAPEHYTAYRRRNKLAMWLLAPALVLELVFSPLPHAPLAVRIASAALLVGAAGLAVRSNILYVMAWDELQRRALAESGAVAALVTMLILGAYAYGQLLFGLPHAGAMVWFALAAAIWILALPLVRRHYES